MTRAKKGREYYGNIVTVRALEDCIRVTKKYTEGTRTIKKPSPVQGDDTPSRVSYKQYEVYPDLKIIGWDMNVVDFFDYWWRNTPSVEIMFHYDYRSNVASVIIKDGEKALCKLRNAIPGFGDALKALNGIR